MVLSLQQGILYGPVNSRRYGKSLGINLMPCDFKLCSFNCLYCHYGLTRKCTTDIAAHAGHLPSPGDVAAALEEALKSPVEIDLITFSGNGEPTLYPGFPELVDSVVDLRDRYRPDAKVALLSNSSGLERTEVRDCMARIDLPVLKLDAGTPETFAAINRPAKGIRFERIVERLCMLEDICIQTVLVYGSPSNATSAELSAYFELLRQIRPREVHIYSIDRPVPNRRISLVTPEQLEAIAERARRETGIEVKAYCKKR